MQGHHTLLPRFGLLLSSLEQLQGNALAAMFLMNCHACHIGVCLAQLICKSCQHLLQTNTVAVSGFAVSGVAVTEDLMTLMTTGICNSK